MKKTRLSVATAAFLLSALLFSLFSPVVRADGPFLEKVTYQDTDAQLAYTGTWMGLDEMGGADEGTIHFSSAGGSAVELAFYGCGIEVIGEKDVDKGRVRIEIGDLAPVLLDTYSSSLKTQCVLFSKELTLGWHTITITVLNDGEFFTLDSFKVLRPKVTKTTYNYDDPHINYTGIWGESPTDGKWTNIIGNTATLSFHGMSISAYFEVNSTRGMVEISLDGGAPERVDLCQPGLSRKWPFVITSLTDDDHTITIKTIDRGDGNVVVNFFSFVVESTSAAPSIPTVEESFDYDHESITGNWTVGVSGALPVGLPGLVPSVTPAVATITFTGAAISLYGGCDPHAGTVKVTIDGSFVDTFTPAAGASWYVRQLFKQYSGLTEGEHTMTIEYESGYWIWLYGYTTLNYDYSGIDDDDGISATLSPADPEEKRPSQKDDGDDDDYDDDDDDDSEIPDTGVSFPAVAGFAVMLCPALLAAGFTRRKRYGNQKT